jgi:hypothetical protein
VGKVVQPLQSVNYHDSHAHGHERHGPFTRLVGFGWFGSGQVLGLDSFGYRGETCELCLVLATGVRPVSSIWFSTGVTPGSLRPLITLGNLGAWLCIDIV